MYTLFTRILLLCMIVSLTACQGGSGGSSNSSMAGILTIIANQNEIVLGSTSNLTISLTNSQNIITAVDVAVISSDVTIATVSPTMCSLTTQNNSCTVDINTLGVGMVMISATALNYEPVSSDVIEITPPVNQWAWMNGSDLTNAYGIYGTLGVPSSANIIGGRLGATTWSAPNGRLYLFGGNGYADSADGGYLNDAWEYNIGTSQWRWIGGSNTRNQNGVYGALRIASNSSFPGGRDSSVSWVDENGSLWLFGGYGFGESGWYSQLNDLWRLDSSTSQWTWMGGSKEILQPGVYGGLTQESSGNIPGARRGAVSWTDASGNMWLFGGDGFAKSDNEGLLNDLWRFSQSSHEWAWMGGSDIIDQHGSYGMLNIENSLNTPGGRSNAVIWNESNNYIWMFGGYGFAESGVQGQLNDLWRFNPSNSQWTWMGGNKIINQPGVYGTQGVSNSNNLPGARSGAVSWTDESGNMCLLGGNGYADSVNSGYLDDLWCLNHITQEWTWMKGSNTINQKGIYGSLGSESISNMPGARRAASSWIDESGNLWLFGGVGYAESGSDGYLNDLWRYLQVQ